MKAPLFLFGVCYPLMILGSIMWWCGQMEMGFWYAQPANAAMYFLSMGNETISST